MSIKPTVFGLSGEAKNFVFDNVPLFFNHIKIIFPLLVVADLVKKIGHVSHAGWVSYVMAAMTLFLYACFALAWHRSSLNGPDKAHEVNPVSIRRDDTRFIVLFMILAGVFGLVTAGLTYATEVLAPTYGKGIALLANLGAIVIMVLAMIAFLKLSFLLPAQSVGVRLGIKDAMRASKGAVWPLIGSNFIFAVLFIVVLTVYVFVAAFITSVAAAGVATDDVKVIAVGTVLSMPITLAAMFLVALSVTALSRAYQWGIQNNPL